MNCSPRPGPQVLDNPPAPGTPEWRGMITASKVPTILGLSKFDTPYSLWHAMAGNFTPPALSGDHLDWGHIIEDSLAGWWLHKANADETGTGWQLNSGEVTYTDPALPFPNLVTLDRRARRGRRFHIVECKTDRDRTRWGHPGEADSVPLDYTAQVMFQMGVSGIHEASVVVQLGGSGVPEVHAVEWDPGLFQLIVDRCIAWHHSILDGDEPDLDDEPATYKAVRGLHPDIERGEDVFVDFDLARSYLTAVSDEAAAKKAATGAKSSLLAAMGSAQFAVTDAPGVGRVKIADRRLGARKSVTLYPARGVEL